MPHLDPRPSLNHKPVPFRPVEFPGSVKYGGYPDPLWVRLAKVAITTAVFGSVVLGLAALIVAFIRGGR